MVTSASTPHADEGEHRAPSSRRGKRWLYWVGGYVVAVALSWGLSFFLPSWHYGVRAWEGSGVITQRESKHVFLWGSIGGPIHVSSEQEGKYRCESNALHEVRVNTNLGHALVAALTLGIWTPAEIEWQCAAPEEDGGDLG